MPSKKTWYFLVLPSDSGSSIRVFTGEGAELKKGRGKTFGAVVEISPGDVHAQEGTPPEQRKSLLKVINRMTIKIE